MDYGSNPLWQILPVNQDSALVFLTSIVQATACWPPSPFLLVMGEGRKERATVAATTIPCHWRNNPGPFVRPPTHPPSPGKVCARPSRSLSLHLALPGWHQLCCQSSYSILVFSWLWEDKLKSLLGHFAAVRFYITPTLSNPQSGLCFCNNPHQAVMRIDWDNELKRSRVPATR